MYKSITHLCIISFLTGLFSGFGVFVLHNLNMDDKSVKEPTLEVFCKDTTNIIDTINSTDTMVSIDKYEVSIEQEVEEFSVIDNTLLITTKVNIYKNDNLHIIELFLSDKCKNNDSLIKAVKDSQYRQALPTYNRLKEILKVK